eukprot:scaffold124745_cov16-Tisochrysis_lutea.AAC.1
MTGPRDWHSLGPCAACQVYKRLEQGPQRITSLHRFKAPQQISAVRLQRGVGAHGELRKGKPVEGVPLMEGVRQRYQEQHAKGKALAEA